MGAGRFLAATALALLAVSAEAQTLESCGLQVLSPLPHAVTDKEPVVLTFRGSVTACSSVRVAAVGEAGPLGLPQPAGALNIIFAQRPDPLPPGTGCPAVLVPFEIEVRLPDRLPAIPPPGLFPIGVYYRFEDENGNLGNQLSCGTVQLAVGEGYRSLLPFHKGRFHASITWNTASQSGDGFEVPIDATSEDSGLFWFFDPGNWELMVKVLNGCGVNQHFWVIGAAATDVKYTLRITDAATGAVWTHASPGGQLEQAFADVEAFFCAGAE